MEKFQFWEIQQTKELSKRPIVKNLFPNEKFYSKVICQYFRVELFTLDIQCYVQFKRRHPTDIIWNSCLQCFAKCTGKNLSKSAYFTKIRTPFQVSSCKF